MKDKHNRNNNRKRSGPYDRDLDDNNRNKRRRINPSTNNIAPLDNNDENDGKTSMNEPLTLDVGGIKYKTMKSTLSTTPDTVLFKMFDGNFCIQPSRDGSYFIDRDDKHFRYILNFLQMDM